MDIRYSANQKDFKRYTTEEARKEFLIEDLYVANEVVAVYSHVDRMVTLGCMPTTEKALTSGKTLAPTFSWNAGRSGFLISAARARPLLTARCSIWGTRIAFI